MEVTFLPLTKEHAKEEILKDSYVHFMLDSYEIYYQNQWIGMVSLTPFIGKSLSISLMIFPKYRGMGLAGMVSNQVVDFFGAQYPEMQYFIYNVDPINIRSLKVAKKLGWVENHLFDDMMEEEGTTIYRIFQKENPYYRSLKEGRYVSK